MGYRLHEIKVRVVVHDSIPEGNDAASMLELIKDINNLATGDVIVISATMTKPEEF